MDTPEAREYPRFIVPHSDHGDPECCGLILPEVRGDETDLTCNECGMVFSTVPTADADQKLEEMASGEICSATCPHCGELNIFPGFAVMMAYICRHCGEGVQVGDLVQ